MDITRVYVYLYTDSFYIFSVLYFTIYSEKYFTTLKLLIYLYIRDPFTFLFGERIRL